MLGFDHIRNQNVKRKPPEFCYIVFSFRLTTNTLDFKQRGDNFIAFRSISPVIHQEAADITGASKVKRCLFLTFSHSCRFQADIGGIYMATGKSEFTFARFPNQSQCHPAIANVTHNSGINRRDGLFILVGCGMNDASTEILAGQDGIGCIFPVFGAGNINLLLKFYCGPFTIVFGISLDEGIAPTVERDRTNWEKVTEGALKIANPIAVILGVLNPKNGNARVPLLNHKLSCFKA